jgi:hypothetical protein
MMQGGTGGCQGSSQPASLPPDADLRAAYAEYFNSLTWPGLQTRLPRFGKIIAEKGLHDMELRLGDYTGIGNQRP